MNESPSNVAPFTPIDAAGYRLLFEHNPQAMWLFDQQTLGFVDVNQAAVLTYGYSREEFLQMDVTQIRPEEDEPDHPPHVGTHRTKDGRLIDVEVVSRRLTLDGRAVRLAVMRDVSAHQKEDRQRPAPEIEQLAGGLADDFSNLLTAIISHSEHLSDCLDPSDPRAVQVVGIRRAADRAASLTRQLLAFSRRQILQPAVVDLNDIVHKTRGVLARLIGERIELVVDLEPSLGRVKADPGQVEQILLNLAVNARGAMPDGGRLTLRTRNTFMDRAGGRRVEMTEGDYVELTLADTGGGFDAGVKAHLFEPFFTTKELGRGTGLGLATVFGIVKQSGGHITVESDAAGQGTTFSIFLPATLEAPLRPGVDDRGVSTGRTSEMVLLVEDDQAVRALIADVLRRRGYRLLAAEDGNRALEVAAAYDGSIDLLITDAIISGTGGCAVADALRARHAGIKVLYVTGAADAALMPSGFLETDAAFLHKPFTPDALARKVRAVLDSDR